MLRILFLIGVLTFQIPVDAQECESQVSTLMSEAGACFNTLFSSDEVNKEEFKKTFEDYFLDNDLIENPKSKGVLYYEILSVFETNPDYLPSVKNAKYVAETAGKLGITIPDLEKYKHLECLRNKYDEYRTSCPSDTTSILYVLGDISSTLQQLPRIHYQLIASTIRRFSTAKDFESECAQDTIMMLFWFQTAGRYGQW